MYQRKRKDEFCKKIEQMILGRNKRLRNDIEDTSTFTNNNCTSSTSTNNNCTSSTSTNNNCTSSTSTNNNCTSSTSTNNCTSSIGNINDVDSAFGNLSGLRCFRWIPANKKIEGIRKFGINGVR
jgi:hypothetical protein